MAVPDFIITALANIDHLQEEAPAWLTLHVLVLTIPSDPEETLLRSWKFHWKMNLNQKIHSQITNPSLHSNSIGLQTILVIWSLTHREGVVLCSLYFIPKIFAIFGDRTPNLTTILITTDHYTPYPKYRPWARLSHSLMAVHLHVYLMANPSPCISHSHTSRCLMYFISALWSLSLPHAHPIYPSWLAFVL